MNNAVKSSHLSPALFILHLAASAAAPVAAQEYCIACTGPGAVYRCVIDRAEPSGVRLKALCTGMLARQGGHATCAVRSGTVFDCDGPVRRIDARAAATILDGAVPLPPKAEKAGPAGLKPALPNAEPTGRQPADPASRPADAPPRTVEEAAREMTKSSGEAWQKAGDAIGSSTRKAWSCVTSLFKSC